MADRCGNNGNSDRLYFILLQKALQMLTAAIIIKDAYSLEKKTMTNLDNIIKSEILLYDKGLSSQGYVFFPVVTYGCESWTVKKAEHQKIVIFELWC